MRAEPTRAAALGSRVRRANPGPVFVFVLALGAIVVGSALLAARRPLDMNRAGSVVAWAVASLGWLAALLVARRVPDSRGSLALVLAGALVLRGVWFSGEPALSDDLERYLWEGGLVAAGVDPYASAPSAPELEPFRARWSSVFERVAHRDVAAVYPPLAEVALAGAVTLAGGPEHASRARLFLRGVFTLSDLGVTAALLVLLHRRGLPLARASVWAWCPLVALEFAGAGHLDALAILFVVLALLAASAPHVRAGGGRAVRTVAALVAGAAVKLLPIVLLPCALARGRAGAEHAGAGLGRALAVAAAALFLALLPFVLLTGSVPSAGGLAEYSFRWESFNLLFRWIEPLFDARYPRDESWTDPRWLARAGCAAAWIALAVLTWWHAWWHELDLERAGARLFGGFLLLTPTLHPWYLTWIVPFLVLQPSAAWAWLVAAAPLLYWPVERWRAEHLWLEPAWLWPLVGGSFLALLALERFLVRSRAR